MPEEGKEHIALYNGSLPVFCFALVSKINAPMDAFNRRVVGSSLLGVPDYWLRAEGRKLKKLQEGIAEVLGRSEAPTSDDASDSEAQSVGLEIVTISPGGLEIVPWALRSA